MKRTGGRWDSHALDPLWAKRQVRERMLTTTDTGGCTVVGGSAQAELANDGRLDREGMSVLLPSPRTTLCNGIST